MTYCVGMLLDAGLVFLSDSRTNAGVDHINTFRKVSIFERPGDRVVALMTSGNLAVTQSLVNILKEQLAREDAAVTTLFNVANMFEAARCVGDAVREVHKRDAEALREFDIEFNPSFILGGQICGEPPRLFRIYAAGNFIEATADTPYFQIGESKYGKPIIDRVVRSATTLHEAAKCALISMDSTIRSNLSVGLPLDLVCIKRDTLGVMLHKRIDGDDPYYRMISSRWGQSLRDAFAALPEPDWLPEE